MDTKKLFIIFSLMGLLAACDKKSESASSETVPPDSTVESVTAGKDGTNGINGTNGVDGKDGKNVVLASLTIVVDRGITWSDNRIDITHTGVLTIPSVIDVLLLTNNENGGWVDFIIEKSDSTERHHYCYQGVNGQKRYAFSYKKISGSTQGCDQNNEKETAAVSTTMDVQAGDDLVIIPRAPRLAGIKPTFTFHYLGIEP
jgi:hypothetical protein